MLKLAAFQVSQLKIGEAFNIGRTVLREIGSFPVTPGLLWSPVDRIMDRVVGSSWTIKITENPDGSVTFYRVEEQDEPLWICPDRR